MDVHPACAVVAPPDFCALVINIVTLHDVALRHLLGPVPDTPSARPSFTRYIAPILDRLAKLAWVQSGTRDAGSAGCEFADLKALAEAEGERRNVVFKRFRNPNLPPESAEAKQQTTSDFVPALSGDSGDAAPGIPANWLSVTKTQYETLGKWRDGNFDNDWASAFPESSQDISPDGLERAALDACAGGAFYPGIEGGWLLRNAQAYEAPFALPTRACVRGDFTQAVAA